jgi:hypothetical protein
MSLELTKHPEIVFAVERAISGEPFCMTTDIAGYTCGGYDGPDDLGFWEYEIPMYLLFLKNKRNRIARRLMRSRRSVSPTTGPPADR